MRWRVVVCVVFWGITSFSGSTLQGQQSRSTALEWIRKENGKYPRHIQQWLQTVDKEELFEKGVPASAIVKPEGFLDGDQQVGKVTLPLPPIGYRLARQAFIRLGGNLCSLASYSRIADHADTLSILFRWDGRSWSKLLQNEGTTDSIEGIEFIRLNPHHDPLVVVTTFGGGSGAGCDLFWVGGVGMPRHLLNIGTWNEGGYNLRDFDGDGVYELVHRTRVFHPKDLEIRLKKIEDFDGVSPILYQDTIYRWAVDHFQKIGVRYWIDG